MRYDPTIGTCSLFPLAIRRVARDHAIGTNVLSEDSYSVTRTVDGLPYFLSVTDTAGQEEYRGLWTAATLQSDAFLLVYDITNPSSLETLDHFIEMINMEAKQRVEDNQRLRKELGPTAGPGVGTPPPVKIVAGNKCDLKDGRAVTAREGLEYARRRGCGFMETSAREMVNIEETFAHLVRRVIEARRVHLQGPGRPPSRTGQSVHTTALPQTTTDVTTRKVRPGRLLGAGKGRQLAETESEGIQGCLFRRLCCACC
ncbi:ras small monomeric GTPase [Penicillium sp. IBT 16267x]|nr:ras small monomeric GTPase [Penicillium sp. IBT 16267x]